MSINIKVGAAVGIILTYIAYFALRVPASEFFNHFGITDNYIIGFAALIGLVILAIAGVME
ncbi:hypothetical protein [Haloferax larsenii]|uniref:Uncharacterized protein n=1 Tax=Haloferax larsenii TaxID=302484 RepID=A0A1H7QQV2_HALLR|nr:hypothetical protein [Haloferax larsenii]SEL50269.1 hypothetical protein SAMN04488691_105121 [Haloferax larsenii]